ncbi:MAG: hypothetical protein AUH92_02920 [Acidobacteria bacterium 13_1_40CM_4_69_4]|nr:MAG: hypothetical protein AUH92_02920 [Acidobacteria bacterium 13_1_40CM_4_69_4]
MDETRRSGAPAAAAPSARINRVYDQFMYDDLFRAYWGHSDFVNFGYWAPGTRDQQEACENLMEKLLAFLPERTGTILDAACGKGATTRHLLKYYAPEAVTGINISEKQLQTCAANAPGCRFLLMNAADLKFEDGTFDNILCVEAAFHFDTRERFLREACRVLKPGGRLLLSDSLFTRWWERIKPPGRMLNYVEDAAAYRELCQSAGFGEAESVAQLRPLPAGPLPRRGDRSGRPREDERQNVALRPQHPPLSAGGGAQAGRPGPRRHGIRYQTFTLSQRAIGR